MSKLYPLRDVDTAGSPNKIPRLGDESSADSIGEYIQCVFTLVLLKSIIVKSMAQDRQASCVAVG